MKVTTTEKLDKLFFNSAAVLHLAGIDVTHDKRAAQMPGCFVNTFAAHSTDPHGDAVKSLESFVDKLDVSNVSAARASVLKFLSIENDGSDKFNIPAKK